MTADLLTRITNAANPASINGRRGDAIKAIRIVLDKANVEPLEAILHLGRERARTYLRPRLKHADPECLRSALERFQHDHRENYRATEAIAKTLVAMDDEPTPAQLGKLGRHFLTAPPEAKWPALPCEFVGAVHRLQKQGKISKQKCDAAIEYVESLVHIVSTDN